MSIIKEKINNYYDIEELKKKCKKFIFSYLTTNKKRKIPALYEITKSIDIANLEYTLEDFKKDYPEMTGFKEIQTVFNIYSSGLSMEGYSKKIGMPPKGLPTFLKQGFYYNSTVFIKMLEVVKIEYDISNFKIEFYENHIELYGEKEKLMEFKNLYNLEEKVYYEFYKNSWHLAFRGLLAEYIRLEEKKRKEE